MDEIIGYPVLNRTSELPKDGWYHIAPVGEFPHPSGVRQVLDNRAIDSMVEAFEADKKKLGDHFPGVLVDFDHFSNDPKAPSEAAGWIEEVQNRTDQKDPKDNGLWAQISWSDTGEQAVKGKRYRLVSPVWNRSDCEELGDEKIRPLRLDRIALTNDPNLKGMNPLTNRAEDKKKEEAGVTPESIAKAFAQDTGPVRQAPTRNRGTSTGAFSGHATRRGAQAQKHLNLAAEAYRAGNKDEGDAHSRRAEEHMRKGAEAIKAARMSRNIPD